MLLIAFLPLGIQSLTLIKFLFGATLLFTSLVCGRERRGRIELLLLD